MLLEGLFMGNKIILKKLHNLEEILLKMNHIAVAFSSGVDSTFLLKIAHDILKDNVIAVTARSCLFPQRELEESIEFCKKNGIKQFFVDIDALKIPNFDKNSENRCYICKQFLFQKIIAVAEQNGIKTVCEGSNIDDTKDYRPGLVAIEEIGVKSPLMQAGLYKSEIRQLSKKMNLPTWQKPSFACLASRFAYGETITKEKLKKVEKAEQLLINLGFSQMRVRMHGTIARIEVLPKEFSTLLKNREKITTELLRLGFSYATMDLQGYRTGSMNELVLKGRKQT